MAGRCTFSTDERGKRGWVDQAVIHHNGAACKEEHITTWAGDAADDARARGPFGQEAARSPHRSQAAMAALVPGASRGKFWNTSACIGGCQTNLKSGTAGVWRQERSWQQAGVLRLPCVLLAATRSACRLARPRAHAPAGAGPSNRATQGWGWRCQW